MANPLGGLFANVVVGTEGGVESDAEGVKATTPANYLKGLASY
jgi:hypothetical protein